MLYQPTWRSSRIWAVMRLMQHIRLFSWQTELIEEAHRINRVWARNGLEL